MERKKASSEVFPMKGGDGVSSYANNSSYQKLVSDASKLFISEAIEKNLDIANILNETTLRIADFGCSVGPNTFFTIQNIITSVEHAYRSKTSTRTLEFHVFFNDHVSNDFNTLFKTLPTNKPYDAAGVPGSFYNCLFPRASIHVSHSSFALQWLSKVPDDVIDRRALAWNKGRIHYASAHDDVIEAYKNQFGRDVGRFLDARGHEMVCGGLVVVVVPGRPAGVPHSEVSISVVFEMLGSCLMNMAKEGVIDEEKVDYLNIPIYFASAREWEEAITKNGCFSIERLEGLPQVNEPEMMLKPKTKAMGLRAGLEGIFKGQLTDEIIDELFESYREKLEKLPPSFYDTQKSVNLFMVLKRNDK